MDTTPRASVNQSPRRRPPRWRRKPFTAVEAAVLVMLVVGCGSGRSKHVEHNLALLDALPTIPSTRETTVTSVPYLETTGPELLRRTAGYTTTATIKTPRNTTGRTIVTFYRQRLNGWRCRMTASTPRRDSFILECTRGRRRINVNTDNLESPRHLYELTVDADGPPE